MRVALFATEGPVVLVDLDGVVVDTFAGMQAAAAAADIRGWQPLAPGEATQYYYERHYPAEIASQVKATYAEPGFYLNLQPIPEALTAVRDLATQYPTYLCSTPDPHNPTCASDKFAWVERWLGGSWVKHLCLTFDKTMVRGKLLIDDKPYIEGSMKPEWEHLLFDNGAGYARHNISAPRINWQNWREVVEARLRFWADCTV